MSAESTNLLGSLLVSAVVLVISVLIRIRGPVGLVKHVDWTRVSDQQGFGQFVSLIMLVLGAVIAAHGATTYAFAAEPRWRDASTTLFVVCVAALALTMYIGKRRYENLPANDDGDRHERR